jgi:hypothetical protein
MKSLHEQALGHASELSKLMLSCRHPQHLSATAERCRNLMNEVINKMVSEIRSATNGQVDQDDQTTFAALVTEARKIVEAMKVHVGK